MESITRPSHHLHTLQPTPQHNSSAGDQPTPEKKGLLWSVPWRAVQANPHTENETSAAHTSSSAATSCQAKPRRPRLQRRASHKAHRAQHHPIAASARRLSLYCCWSHATTTKTKPCRGQGCVRGSSARLQFCLELTTPGNLLTDSCSAPTASTHSKTRVLCVGACLQPPTPGHRGHDSLHPKNVVLEEGVPATLSKTTDGWFGCHLNCRGRFD